MSQTTAAQTQTLRTGENDIAYREVGSGPPIVLLQRFRGTIDDWDPEFVDRLSDSHRVIAFDAPGVGGSSGAPTTSISAMADDAAEVIAALDLGAAHVIGWSMGGMVAQALAILHPQFVRSAVFAGTCPPGNPRLATAPDSWIQVALKPAYDLNDVVALFYTQSDASRAAAASSEQRMAARIDRVAPVSPDAIQAQIQAMMGYYRNAEGLFDRLGEIGSPVLIAAGDHDASFPPVNQLVLLESIPGATLAIYPDAGHGFHMQHTAAFCDAIENFLAGSSVNPFDSRESP